MINALRYKRTLRLLILAIIGLGFWEISSAQMPNLNASNRLDVLSWNVEWLGSSSNGPSSESIQMTNVTRLINEIQVDILGLCEISSASAWSDILEKCPDYNGSISTWDQIQKTAVLFRKSEFKLAYSKHILSEYSYDFASGRLPLEVGLIPLNNKFNFDTLRVWILHLKANTGSSTQKIEAYNRRYNASMVLKSYIQKLGNNKSGIILGDWNDDFDVSILSGYGTPFANWTKDTQYLIATLPLSVSKQKSTVSYSEMIDHIVTLPVLKSAVVKDSVFVFNPTPWINNYGNSTSDHYPVYARFNVTKRSNDVNDLNRIDPLLFCDEDRKIITRGISISNIQRIEQYDFAGRYLKTTECQFDSIEMIQPAEIIRVYTIDGSVLTFKLIQP